MSNIFHIHVQGLFNPADGISDGVDTGGQTRFVHELSLAQARQGHNTTVVTRLMNAAVTGSSESEMPVQEYGRNGDMPYTIRRVEFGDPKRFIRKEDIYPLAPKIADTIMHDMSDELANADVLVSHYADAGLTAEHLKTMIFEKTGRIVPHIHMPHSIGYAKFTGLLDGLPEDEQERENVIKEICSDKYNFNDRIAVEKYLYNNSDIVVHTSPNQVVMGTSHPYYAVNTPTNIVYPGYNKETFQTVDATKAERVEELEKLGFPGIKEDDFVICMAARFVPEKGFSSLIKALPYVLEARPNTKVLMIGGNYKDAKDKGLLRSLQHEVDDTLGTAKGNDAVIFWHEGMPQEELAKVMAHSDVFTSLRHNEPFGMAPLEALASGANSVVDKTSGIAQTLPAGVITSCDASNPQELAAAILEADKTDKQFVLDHVNSNYTWEAVSIKLLSSLNKVSMISPPRDVPTLNELTQEDFLDLKISKVKASKLTLDN